MDQEHLVDALAVAERLADTVVRILTAAPPGYSGETLVGVCLRAYARRTEAIESLAHAQTKAAEAQRAQTAEIERIANALQRK